MSIRVMTEVWKTNLPTTEKMVLLVIADHASDDGTNAYPSQKTIANKASISIRTVQRCVNNLVASKYLQMDKHAGGSARCRDDRRPHLYTINLDRLRVDSVTTRTRGDIEDIDGATITPITGRQSRPKNHTIKPSLEPPLQFDEFWKIYPLKVGKKPAQAAFEKAIKVVALEVILEGARRYAGDPNRHPSYTAHPSTWLNQERWGDAPLPPREKTAQERKEEELQKSRERDERAKAEREAWQRELEAQRAVAVPASPEIKEMLRKALQK
jgi:DNA-binding transcriptional regulator YhcF (GntR family)